MDVSRAKKMKQRNQYNMDLKYPLSTTKIEQNLSAIEKCPTKKPKSFVVLLLSGSFNPVHKMHIHTFEVAKKHLQLDNPNLFVVGGYIAPSSDSYVLGKLQKEAMTLGHRSSMCGIETRKSDWIEVCNWGLASGHTVTREITEILKRNFPEQKIRTLEICGADHALKYNLWRHKPMVCLGRPQYTEKVKQALTKEEPNPKEFFFIEEELQEVSSTEVRQAMKSQDPEKMEELVTKGWIDEDILLYIKEQGPNLYLVQKHS